MNSIFTFQRAATFMVAGLFLWTTGCSLIRAKQDLVVRNENVTLSGTVISDKATSKPLCVALYAKMPEGQTNKLTAYQVVYQNGTFSFHPKAGDYYLFAFEDANEDGAFQFTERIGWHGDPSMISVKPGETLDTFKLALRPPKQARKELPLLYSRPLPQVEMRLENKHVGTVISLSDPRFDPETGVLGMWEPAAFFERYGGGLFFLQPYSEKKIPVLFFHGVGGTPRNFETLISKLDTNRYQPWIVHYPSGIRLTVLADQFAKLIKEVQIRHKVPQIVVVAHSMGGLVARGAINKLTQDKQSFVPLFVSISSPWQGHPGAGAGVEHSPVVLPCWFDMSPGSPYLEDLQKTPLPAGSSYYLLFGYRGGKAAFADGNTDGTLPISSMLDLGMQDNAVNVFGFNENHVSILHSADVATRLNRILDKSTR
jgi:pimeloyl-ACP methyl ester carboxylesterase